MWQHDTHNKKLEFMKFSDLILCHEKTVFFRIFFTSTTNFSKKYDVHVYKTYIILKDNFMGNNLTPKLSA